MLSSLDDIIVAESTPPGLGGIAIVRLSGKNLFKILTVICSTNTPPPARTAIYSKFYNSKKESIDDGLYIYFCSPKTFTGQDLLEFHCHGSPHVISQIIKTCIELGARLARPGEFTERAYLNGKLDLAQAEAVADIIDSQSEAAAKICSTIVTVGSFF